MRHIESKIKERLLPLTERLGVQPLLRGVYIHAKQLIDPLLRPRRFQCFGLGMGKSGTHSLAALFEDRYHSAHEPYCKGMIEVLLRRARGEVAEDAFQSFLRTRDKHMWLELEVSTLIVHYAKDLQELFPEARFILLIRDPYSWLNSSWNHLATRSYPDWFHRLDSWRYGADQWNYAPGEKAVLSRHKLPSTLAHLRLWGEQNQALIETIDPQRLLVVRTPDLGREIGRIADFLQIDPRTLSARKHHRYRASRDLGLIHEVEQSYLEDVVRKFCAPVVRKVYPEIQCLEDAVRIGFVAPPMET